MGANPTPPAKASVQRSTNTAIGALAWSPDGSAIVTGCWDGAHIWDTAGSHRLHYSGHQSITAVAWSPNGRSIASAGADNKIHLWDAVTGALQFEYCQHHQTITSVAWSPDGTRIVSGGFDNGAQVWDVDSGDLLLTYRGQASPVWFISTLVWSPSGALIASCCGDEFALVWDPHNGKTLLTYQHFTNWVRQIAWAPDNQRLVSTSDDTIHLWDITTGTNRLTYHGHTIGKSFAGPLVHVRALAWSPDGRRIASACGEQVLLWNPITGETHDEHRTASGTITSLAWSPDGALLACGSGSNTLELWQPS